ncbi:MAG: MFS transporter [Candidatus Nanopelagicales bacterium]
MGFLSGTSFIPAPSKGFYGWRMVAFASVALALTGPGQTVGISVFVDPMIDDLGISRTEMTTAYLIGTLTGAVALPWIGQAVDRFGVRRIMALVGLLFGAMLISMSVVSNIVGLTAGFVGIRMMGQGSLSLVATTAVALWFTRKRGLAMGIVSAAGGVGMTLIPLAGERMIFELGWRNAWLIEGLVIWAIVVPMAIFAIRNRPSDLGQHVDGDPEAPTNAPEVWGVTRREAMKTPFFWIVTLAVTASGTLTTAVVFNQIDLLGSRGLTPAEAAANFIPQTVATLLATLGIGALADRISPRAVLITSMAMLAGGLLLGTQVSPGLVAVAFGMLIGGSGGAMRVVEATELPRYFGTLHIGSIRGVVTGATIAGSAVGPLLFALGLAVTGDYSAILVLSALFPISVIIAAFFIRLPRHTTPDEHGDSHLVHEA